MSTKVTRSSVLSKISSDPDAYAIDFLPRDSFARHAYENKPYPAIRSAHSATNADKQECEKWGLSADDWVEEIDAARIALAHDLKLDLIKKGITPAM